MQMTLVAEVATAYFELVALDHELGVVRRTVESPARRACVRAKLRFEGGLTSETAYQQAKVELASASALIPDLELRIAQKENQISVLAGDYPSRVARSQMDMNVRDARLAARGPSFDAAATPSRRAAGRAEPQGGDGLGGHGLCRPGSRG